eukprot:1160739-Pelagomonas_calceolata.AAC.5
MQCVSTGDHPAGRIGAQDPDSSTRLQLHSAAGGGGACFLSRAANGIHRQASPLTMRALNRRA